MYLHKVVWWCTIYLSKTKDLARGNTRVFFMYPIFSKTKEKMLVLTIYLFRGACKSYTEGMKPPVVQYKVELLDPRSLDVKASYTFDVEDTPESINEFFDILHELEGNTKRRRLPQGKEYVMNVQRMEQKHG